MVPLTISNLLVDQTDSTIPFYRERSIMRAFTLALGLLLCAGQASAANAYKFYDVDVENAPAVLAATDAFMNSETGKRFKGALHLNTYLANGASPATHAFVMLMPSMAAITAWEAEMAASNDGQASSPASALTERPRGNPWVPCLRPGETRPMMIGFGW